MSDVRIVETYDGVCTVTVGSMLVFQVPSREEAEMIAARFCGLAGESV